MVPLPGAPTRGTRCATTRCPRRGDQDDRPAPAAGRHRPAAAREPARRARRHHARPAAALVADARLVGALGRRRAGMLAVARLSGTVATTYNLERLACSRSPSPASASASCSTASARRNVVGRLLVGAVRRRPAARRRHGFGPRDGGHAASRDAANLYALGRGLRAVLDLARRGGRGAAGSAQTPRPARRSTPTATRSCGCSRSRGRGTSFLTAVTPRTLDQHAWVYASRSNWVDGRARDAIGQRPRHVRVPARLPGRPLRPPVREPAGGGVPPVIAPLLHPVRRALAACRPAAAGRCACSPSRATRTRTWSCSTASCAAAARTSTTSAAPRRSQSLNAAPAAPRARARPGLRGARVLHVHWLYPFGLRWARRGRPALAPRRAARWRCCRPRACVGLRVVWTVHNVVPHAAVFADDARARRRLLTPATS